MTIKKFLSTYGFFLFLGVTAVNVALVTGFYRYRVAGGNHLPVPGRPHEFARAN